MNIPVRFTDHDGTVKIGTIRVAGTAAVDVWHESRLRTLTVDRVRRLCGRCTTKLDTGRRVPKTCQDCERLMLA